MPLFDKDEIKKAIPALDCRIGDRLCEGLMRALSLNDINGLYDRNSEFTGPDFARAALKDCGVDYSVAGYDILKNIEGPFITISNHPYGAIDGLMLMDFVGHLFPDYKIIVNDILARIKTMSCNFITVTPTTDAKTEPTRESLSGIRAALEHIHKGKPLGIFPSGAVSDLMPFKMKIQDREWQISIIRLIKKAKLPIVPIRFFDANSAFYYLLGLINWKIRVTRLPAEVFNKRGRTERIGVGNIIPVSEQDRIEDIYLYREYLRSSVYDMRASSLQFIKSSELWK